MRSASGALRSAQGFRLISRRPVFSVVFMPSIPMNDDRLCTSGSANRDCATACWRRDMASNEVFCDDWVTPCSTPPSCTGKNPLGTARYSRPVSTTVATMTSNVRRWWRKVTSSQPA
ncbi:hypothetical protein G6F57_022542 [Rhizopus arrhizus]|nr:hypothetical protein G6F57_022542 [Rhizopus arrhizus]